MAGFDASQMRIKLQDVATRNRDSAAQGLFLAVEHVLGVARSRVPIEEETLERSGATHVDKDTLTGYVYFDTPYAVVQHEDLTLNHDAGRQAKYLESAFNSEAKTCKRIIADTIRKG